MEQLAQAYAKAGNREDAAKLREEIRQTSLPNIEQVLVVDPLRKAAITARQYNWAETVQSATGAMALSRCGTGFPGTAFSNLPDVCSG